MMTDDDIKRLALAAGCFTPGASRNYWAITDQMLRRFAELIQAAEQKRWSDAVAGVARAAADNNDLRVYELMRGLNDALHKAPNDRGEAPSAAHAKPGETR